MPLQATSGAASYDAFGGGVAGPPPNYIEDVFSTWLYTGNNSAQTITNGINLSGKGGLIWFKGRNSSTNHAAMDTARGPTATLFPNLTEAQEFPATIAFNSNGFSFVSGNNASINADGTTYASWTFRKQPKFFDVVTYTGNGAFGRAVPHSLDSVPGFLIVKTVNSSGNWYCQHRQDWQNYYRLEATDAASSYPTLWGNTQPTSTNFYVGVDANISGEVYVAYLFAHDAGGFGLTGTDNVISCGSYTATSNSAPVTLGYEPQWVMIKKTNSTGDWEILDTMRGFNANASGGQYLEANKSNAEFNDFGASITSTGFVGSNQSAGNGNSFIYIAIRRGPMKVPTTGTSVFSPNTVNAPDGTAVTTNFPVDLQWLNPRASTYGTNAVSRLTQVSTVASGTETYLKTNSADAEVTGSTGQTKMWGNTGFEVPGAWGYTSMIYWNFGRAPGFFDQVCYTGTGANRTLAHNLAAVPELMIVKIRTGDNDSWTIWNTTIAAISSDSYLTFSTSARLTGASRFNSTAPTSSVFTVGTDGSVNGNTRTYLAYLFATCPGVSKVGSFTGTGATQTINCGFTGGARFVLIKAISTTGSWYVWDSARGIVSGNDPYLLLNTSAAEVTNTDWVDTAATGFELSSAGGNLANSNGVTYIFLAIA